MSMPVRSVGVAAASIVVGGAAGLVVGKASWSGDGGFGRAAKIDGAAALVGTAAWLGAAGLKPGVAQGALHFGGSALALASIASFLAVPVLIGVSAATTDDRA